MIKELKLFAENTADLGDLAREVIEKTGYGEYLKSLGDEGITRIENVGELVNVMTRYSEENPEATLEDFLEEVTLMSDIDNYDADADTVVMMTVHSAKGLEFDEVFLVGMEEGIFPGVMSLNDASELQEERRLAYVGVTRARKELFVTSCAQRMMYGRTQRNTVSRFAREIPDDLKEKIDNCFMHSSYDDDNFSYKSNRDYFSSEKSYSSDFGGFSSSYTKPKKNEPMFKSSAVVSSKSETTPKASLEYKVGDTVVHRVFGEGLVVSMTPMANDVLVEISFDRVGTKKIMANFAKLTKK